MASSSSPMLLFFSNGRSGPARRMESLLAHLARKERGRLRISLIDADRHPEWVERMQVSEIPTLVLVADKKPVARLEGRASAPQIERMLAPYLSKPQNQPQNELQNQPQNQPAAA